MTNRLKWLEDQLDRDDLTDHEFMILNDEANMLQAQENERRKKILDDMNSRTSQSKSENLIILNRIFQLKEQGHMDKVIDEYGAQFVGDYIITHDFKVRSFCRNPRNPNLQNVWQFFNHEDCVKKLRLLVYWRVYDHYFRLSNPQ